MQVIIPVPLVQITDNASDTLFLTSKDLHRDNLQTTQEFSVKEG